MLIPNLNERQRVYTQNASIIRTFTMKGVQVKYGTALHGRDRTYPQRVYTVGYVSRASVPVSFSPTNILTTPALKCMPVSCQTKACAQVLKSRGLLRGPGETLA
jgi:hypothetical protein